MKNKKLLKLLKFSIPILLMFVIYKEGERELQGINLTQLLLQIKTLSIPQIFFMFLFGILAVSTMVFYDIVLVKKLKLTMPWLPLFKISWISNTFNNVMGLGGLTGAGLRGLLFKQYTDDAKTLITSILWITPFMLTGLSILSPFPLLPFIDEGPIFTKFPWMKIALFGMASFLPIYIVFLLFSRKDLFTQKLNKWSLFAILTSVLEWFAAGAFAWCITVVLGFNIPFYIVLSIFVVAAVAGVISLLPGGFGTFDLIFIIGMQYEGLENIQVVIVLLFYRLFYYLLPFIIGLVIAYFSTPIYRKSKAASRLLE